MPVSEVAWLREQIAAEHLAASRGLQGYAVVANHEFIEARMDRLGDYHQQLVALVGESEAMKIVVAAMEQTQE